MPAGASVVVHRSLAFMHSAKIPPALQADFFCLSPLSLSAATECLSAHPTLKLLCPLKSHIHGYSVLFFQEHIYKEILTFSPIARKDSKKRSGMSL